MMAASVYELELDTQKDVYETPDVPAAVLVAETASVSNNPDVVTARVDMAAARSTFRLAEAGLPAAAATTATAGLMGQTVYEVLVGLRDEAIVETPLQRYHRLQLEVTQLAQELSTKPADEVVDQEVRAGDLRAHVSSLETQLLQLSTHAGNDAHNTKSVTSRLVQQLQRLLQEQAKGHSQSAAPATTAAAMTTDQVVYELFYSSDLAKRVLDDHMLQLDARVGALEKAVGNTAAVHLAAGSLAATVSALDERITLLDPKQLDKLSERVKKILADLDKSAQLRKRQVDSETDVKINTLFDRLDQWDPLVHTLPTLVDRLKSLQHVHQSAIELVATVQAVNMAQTQLAEQLKTHEALLTRVEAGIAANTATVQRNIDVLDKRVSHLLGRIQELSSLGVGAEK